MTDVRWYAVHSQVRAELHACQRLTERGFTVFYPHFWATVSHGRRKMVVKKPLFSRYLFVAISDGQSLYEVNNAPGVSTAVYAGKRALEVMGQHMEELMERADENGLVTFDEPNRPIPYKEGDALTMAKGPFSGFTATISRVDRRNRLCILIDGPTGGIPATVSPDMVDRRNAVTMSPSAARNSRAA